jgi:AcrR family transcriptional regulator
MPRNPTTRPDPSVADRLIDAAEELYGTHGLQGVSLRQISLSAGTGNNYAVQYHFGDAAGLIEAILLKRAPAVDMERAKRLAKLRGHSALSSRDLIDLLVRPVIDHANEDGHRRLARLMLALFSTSGDTQLQLLGGLANLTPVAAEIIEQLNASHPEIPPILLRERLRLASHLVLTSVFNRVEPYDDSFDADLIDNAVDMAAAAVAAPVSEALRAKSQGLCRAASHPSPA